MRKLQKRSLPDEVHDLQRCAYFSAAAGESTGSYSWLLGAAKLGAAIGQHA
jgi:hypothetical protein